MKNTESQTIFQLILPLVILLFLASAFAYLMPMFTPIQTLVFGGGIIIVIVCLVSTEAALYLLIFSMLLSPEGVVGSAGRSSLGRAVTLRMDDFLLLVIGCTWLAKMAINKELGLFIRTPLNKPIAFYIIACLASTLLGSLFGKVELKTGFFFVLKYFQYMFIYLMVVNHLHERRQIRNYLWAMLITCAIVSIIGIAQIPEGVRVSAPFEGEIGEPNTFGGYLVFMVCITTGLFLTSTSLRAKFINGVLISLFIVPLIYTRSRSSYLALIPAMLAFVWLSEKKHIGLLVLVLGALLLPFITPEPAKERVAYTFTQGKNEADVVEIFNVKLDTSTSARLMSWKSVCKDWIKHPFFGFGVAGYGFVDGQYFRVLIETGILGLGAFSVLMYSIFGQGYLIFRRSLKPLEKGISIGFLAGFVGLLAHGLTANTFTIIRIMEPFWFVLAMMIMVPRLGSEPASDKNHKIA
jgi:hypothetical protein